MQSVTFHANGNLNGRVIRLVADELLRSYGIPVEVHHCIPLTTWPEARQAPHLVEVQRLTRAMAERRTCHAAVHVFPATWDQRVLSQQAAVRRAGVSTVCILADVGWGTRKLAHLLDSDVPDAIIVPDYFSYRSLLDFGFPENRLVSAGSPYLDTVLASGNVPFPEGGRRLGAFASPEPSPDEIIARGCSYRQSEAMQMIKRVAGRISGLELEIRAHPRTLPGRNNKVDGQRGRSTLAEFVGRCQGVVATRSLGLIAARLLGRSAVSLQPVPVGDGDRELVFEACGIPIARNEVALEQILANLPQRATTAPDTSSWLFNPGHSNKLICEVIVAAMDRRLPCQVAAGANPMPVGPG